MNPWRDEMDRLGMDTTNKSAFTPPTHMPRVFDRPDLVARVYNQFVYAIMGQITKKSEDYFAGHKVIAYAAKLEFQERNTPHHHCLLWLDCGLLEDLDEIDEIICAELPRVGEDDELRGLVCRLNMHRHSPYCMRDGQCRFGYGEGGTVATTYLDETANRVVYRRRMQEDLKIMPYNPRLTKEFRAHINVERTNGGGAVAYLMKYTLKPPKPTEVQVQTEEERDEQNGPQQEQEIRNDIRTYMRARRVGATEACWRLFEFRNVDIYPSVEAYGIHLSGQRTRLLFNPRLAIDFNNSSTLERYFERPTQYAHLDFLSYMETSKLRKSLPRSMLAQETQIPKDRGSPPYFVTERAERDRVVCRIRYVPPVNVELFALPLILLNSSPRSFEAAKVFGGQQYPSYRDAAMAAGLYVDGNEYYTAFAEAVEICQTRSELRFMVVTLHQQGADPKHLIEAHEDALMADIRLPSVEEKRHEMMRRMIEMSDRHGGRLLRDVPFFAEFTNDQSASTEVERAEVEVLGAMSPNNRENLRQRYSSLKEQQKQVLDEILGTVLDRRNADRHNTDGRAFFLQGHAGTGKTYLLSLLRDMVESEGLFADICATTGIAASMYRNGRTLHSLLGLGVDDADSSETHAKLSKYSPNSQRGELIRSLSLLVIDEASMMQRVLFEHVDCVLKDLRCPHLFPNDDDDDDEDGRRTSALPYFGGITIVFAGDYLQLLPVVPSRRVVELPDGSTTIVPVCLLDEIPWRSSLWTDVKVIRITQQIRQAADTSFANLLMSTAKGTLSETDPLPLNSTASIEESYWFLWRWFRSKDRADIDLDRILVCSTNALVTEHNERALEMFPGTKLTFRSATHIERIRRQRRRQGQQQGGDEEESPHEIISPELTYNYCPTGVPPHVLKLKIGAPVMIIRNVLHPHLVNGKMYIIKRFTRKVLYVSTQPCDGVESQTFMLHRIDFQFDFSDLKVTRRQFPVRLAFSATVHKAQGKTLGKLVVDLRSNFFAPGQLYVALSRTRKSSDVLLLHKEEDKPEGAPTVHPMPVVVSNPVLSQAVHFVEGSIHV